MPRILTALLALAALVTVASGCRDASASADARPAATGPLPYYIGADFTPHWFETPADVPAEIFDACLDYALRAHDALGCRGVSRTDFRWDESRGLEGLILLETNTQPGMTPTSLVPEQAQHCGMSFGALMRWMVEDASCNR